MARGHGDGERITKAREQSLAGMGVVQFRLDIKSLAAAVQEVRDQIDPEKYLKSLRPGQKKLTDKQITEIKLLEDIGVKLQEEITSLQQQMYKDVLKEADLRLSEARSAHRAAEKKAKAMEARFNEEWKTLRDDAEYYSRWEFTSEEARTKTYGATYGYSYYNREHADETFDPKRYKRGERAEEKRRAGLKRESEAYRVAREAKDFIGERERERLSIYGLTYNQAMLAVMRRIREFGGADEMKFTASFENLIHHKTDEQDQRRIIRAAERFPRQWLEQGIHYRRKTGQKLHILRYSNIMQSGGAHYDMAEDKHGRKYDTIRWNMWGFENFPGPDQDENIRKDQNSSNRLHSVLTHEMMHYMETVKPELGRAGNAYRVYRAQNNDPMRLEYANRDYRAELQKSLRTAQKNPEQAALVATIKEKNNAEWQSIEKNMQWAHSEVLTTGFETMVPGAYRMDEIMSDPKHRGFVLACLAVL